MNFLDDVLAGAAGERPDDAALLFGDESWTFAQLNARVDRLAAGLQGLAQRGDRVAVLSENHPAVVEAYYAVPRAAMSLVLLNYRLAPKEITAMLQNSGARVLLGERRLLDVVRGELGDCASLDTVVVIDGEWPAEPGPWPAPVGRTTAVREVFYEDLLSDAGDLRAVDRSPDDLAWLIYTSGTTGRPKGAMLSHANLLAGLQAASLGRPVDASDRYLYPFPLCHVSGHNVCLFHLHGRPVVIMRRFEAGELVAAVERHRITAMSLAPTMIAMVLDHAAVDVADLSSLRSIGYGASAIPAALLRRGLDRFGCDFGQGYGMTELSGNAVFLDAAAHRRGLAGEPQLLRAAGRPGPLIELRIVDDDGCDVAIGESGEIVLRGPQVTSGYWRDDGATAACLVNGWFHTGDVGRCDDSGFLYIVDRLKDIIVTGGENVSSREVEDALYLHPAVREAGVVGASDVRWGENICAFVALREGATASAAELVAHVGEHLAGYKKPKRVIFVDELPKNANGKVVKSELRARLAGCD